MSVRMHMYALPVDQLDDGCLQEVRVDQNFVCISDRNWKSCHMDTIYEIGGTIRCYIGWGVNRILCILTPIDSPPVFAIKEMGAEPLKIHHKALLSRL